MPAGQPTKYRREYAEQAYNYCLLRATDKFLAECFGVDESTINNWKIAHPKFLESIKKAKYIADSQVVRSLQERAVGYEHPEDKIFVNSQGDVTTVKTIKHYPPDTAAAFIWLKNRQGWTDKQQHEHGVSKEAATLLGLIDGKDKGSLPDRQEAQEAI